MKYPIKKYYPVLLNNTVYLYYGKTKDGLHRFRHKTQMRSFEKPKQPVDIFKEVLMTEEQFLIQEIYVGHLDYSSTTTYAVIKSVDLSILYFGQEERKKNYLHSLVKIKAFGISDDNMIAISVNAGNTHTLLMHEQDVKLLGFMEQTESKSEINKGDIVKVFKKNKYHEVNENEMFSVREVFDHKDSDLYGKSSLIPIAGDLPKIPILIENKYLKKLQINEEKKSI
jgi:hypothetical protein